MLKLLFTGLKSGVFTWQVNDKDISWNDSLLKTVLATPGNYKVKISVTNSYCPGSDSIYFPLLEKPHADFDYQYLGRNTNGIAFHFVNKSAKANIWKWTFKGSDTSRLHSPDYNFADTGFAKVKLIASNMDICFDTLEKIIPVVGNIVFYFPNAFSPDDNRLNDGFGLNPNQHYLVSEFHLEIYNRWGARVFETNDVREFWQSNEFQQGVYMYKASIRDIYDILHDGIYGSVAIYR